jgi:hypothetical protein
MNAMTIFTSPSSCSMPQGSHTITGYTGRAISGFSEPTPSSPSARSPEFHQGKILFEPADLACRELASGDVGKACIENEHFVGQAHATFGSRQPVKGAVDITQA